MITIAEKVRNEGILPSNKKVTQTIMKAISIVITYVTKSR